MVSKELISQRQKPRSGRISTESPSVDSQIVHLDRVLTRGEMASEIAHEINNDLTILMGNVELFPLLLANANTDAIAKKLPVMKETLEKIAGFAQSLVSYGKSQEYLELVDINRIIENAVAFLKPQNRFDNIRVSTDLSSDIAPIEGDPGQLQQILVNLLNNAADELRECKEAEPLIHVTTRQSEDGQSIEVSVADNGRGIPESAQPKLFNERFTTKDSGEGFGLLACRLIAERHGGDIRFDTTQGAGSSFELRLPVPTRLPAKASTDSGTPGRMPNQ